MASGKMSTQYITVGSYSLLQNAYGSVKRSMYSNKSIRLLNKELSTSSNNNSIFLTHWLRY